VVGLAGIRTEPAMTTRTKIFLPPKEPLKQECRGDRKIRTETPPL
jgi:hypothetical protein